MVYAGLVVGAVVWLWSLGRIRKVLGQPPERGGELRQTAEVEGDVAEITRRIGEYLTTGGVMLFSALRVEAAEQGRVRFRAARSMLPFMGSLRGEYVVEDRGGSRVRVGFHTNRGAERRAARVAQYIALGLGLPAMVLAGALLLGLAVDHPSPEVRAQSAQVAQIVHFLWPPFLILYLGRRTQWMLEEGLGQVIDRLRFGGS